MTPETVYQRFRKERITTVTRLEYDNQNITMQLTLNSSCLTSHAVECRHCYWLTESTQGKYQYNYILADMHSPGSTNSVTTAETGNN